jgi:hypothetical protein
MCRRIRQWWRAAIAVTAITSPHAAGAEQPVHDVQSVETRYGFEPRGEPAGDNRHLGFNIS